MAETVRTNTINNDVYLKNDDAGQLCVGAAVPLMLPTDNERDLTHLSGKTIINNASFTNNYAENYGGAVYIPCD